MPYGYGSANRGSRSSGPAGGASAGGNYGGNRNSNQSYGGSGQGGATRPNPHTSSGTSKTSKVTAKDIASSKKKFVQNLNHNNAVRAAQTGQKFTPYKGGSRPKGGMSGLGNLLMSGIGMLMGIPGLGLLTGGLGKLGKGLGSLNDKTQSTDFGRSTSLMDYLDMKKFGGYNEREMTRRINMDEAKNLQARIDGGEFGGFGIQTPKAKPTFSDPFRNTVGTTTKVNAPASDAVSSYVPFSNYGKANAATLDGVPLNEALAPTPVEQLRDKAYTGIKENVGSPFSNFLNNLMNADQIAALENEYGSKYGITNTSGGISSDARHMAAMNELSNSLSPMNNKFGNFIGDTGAFLAGAVNEIPALFRGLDSKNLGEIKEDLAANWKGSFGTPNQTTAEQIYGDVFEGSTPVQTASIPTYGTAAAEDITIDGGMLNSPFMETQIGPRIIAAENAYYNQGKMPPEFLGDRIRMNMELGNARGFMGPGFADGGLASLFTRRG